METFIMTGKQYMKKVEATKRVTLQAVHVFMPIRQSTCESTLFDQNSIPPSMIRTTCRSIQLTSYREE